MITLEQWKKTFIKKDTCPWRGPKPMQPGDEDLLIGRRDDRDRFAHEVLTHQLVILHGESGVGKSSLLNAGLVRDLTERGFQPIVCRNWTREMTSPDQPEDFVAAKVATELRFLGIDVDDAAPQSMVEQLNENYGELAVLVLDQFEELIRHQRLFFKRAMDWVVELNSRYDIHVVISLRSEYVHRLKALNAQIRPFSMSTFELEPLTAAEHIRDIIASGNPGQVGSTASLGEDAGQAERAEDDGVGLAISLEAIELLLAEWKMMQQAEFRASDVGLLHLQGALYALHARAKPGAIKAGDVREMMAAGAQRQRDVFTLGLIESVARKLDLCEEACRDEDQASSLDDFLIDGTRAVVRRTVAHLSSGGFKLDREAWDLARLALERELRILKEVPVEAAQRAFRVIYGLSAANTPTASAAADLLNVPRTEVAAKAGIQTPADGPQASSLSELGLTVSPWEADPDGLSAGPMFGYPAHEVVIEELRRFAFALEWLTTSSLIRPTSPAVNSTMLSLIHDGFGEALENWADSEHTGPAEALVLLTGAQGDVFDWIRDDGSYWPQFNGLDSDRTIVNLRWRNCRVTARFRHIVLANCDFRGTRFENCYFEGAVFVNCLLDGATFGDCDIVGPVSAPATAYDTEGMPSFAITGLDASTRAALSHYRGVDFSGSVLYSVTSGIAVTSQPAHRSKLLEWAPQRGGLTMYGGRLSSLMVRSGRFRDGGELALRHIAGSSLDVTEQDAAKIHVFGASIRGLSISRRLSDPNEQQQGDIELTVQSSVLANTWFDEGLTGIARFDNSVVWQLLNVSEPSRYRVTLENCTRYGAVNIGDTSNAGPRADFAEDGIADRAELVHQARLMAYRREPAMVELDEMRRQ